MTVNVQRQFSPFNRQTLNLVFVLKILFFSSECFCCMSPKLFSKTILFAECRLDIHVFFLMSPKINDDKSTKGISHNQSIHDATQSRLYKLQNYGILLYNFIWNN